MHCRKVKTMLTSYQAGECRSSDAAAVEKHLTGCPSCTAELAEIRRLDTLLDTWQAEPAPDGLWEAIVVEVSQAVVMQSSSQSSSQGGSSPKPAPGRSIDRTKARKWYNLPGVLGRQGLLLRDLVAAAAVSLAIFWSAGGWLDQEQMLAAGKTINGAVTNYARVTDMAVEKATATAGEYTRKIFFEEGEGEAGFYNTIFW